MSDVVHIYGLWHPGETRFTLRRCRYIGCSIDPVARAARNWNTVASVKDWLEGLRAYGLVKPEMRVLSVVPEAEAANAEREWIAKARAAKQEGGPPLLNTSAGGERSRHQLREGLRHVIAARYSTGASTKVVAKEFKVSTSTVLSACRQLGVPIRKRQRKSGGGR